MARIWSAACCSAGARWRGALAHERGLTVARWPRPWCRSPSRPRRRWSRDALERAAARRGRASSSPEPPQPVSRTTAAATESPARHDGEGSAHGARLAAGRASADRPGYGAGRDSARRSARRAGTSRRRADAPDGGARAAGHPGARAQSRPHDPRRHQHLRRRRPGQRPGRAGRPGPGRRRATWPPSRPRSPPGTPVRRRPGHPPPRRPRRGRAALGRPLRRAGGGRGRAVAGPRGRVLEAGERLDLAGTTIGVVPTPGHTEDHLAFRLESGAVLVGDHVLGRGTSVVTHPGGRRRRLPGVAAPRARPRPERALLRARSGADRGPGRRPRLLPRPPRLPGAAAARRARPTARRRSTSWWRRSTPTYPREVWPAAAQSTRATLDKLRAEGRVEGRRRAGAPGMTDVPSSAAPTASATSGGRPRHWPRRAARR